MLTELDGELAVVVFDEEEVLEFEVAVGDLERGEMLELWGAQKGVVGM